MKNNPHMKRQAYKLDPVTRKAVPIELTPEEQAAWDKSFSERFTEDCTLKATLHLRKPSTAQKSPPPSPGPNPSSTSS